MIFEEDFLSLETMIPKKAILTKTAPPVGAKGVATAKAQTVDPKVRKPRGQIGMMLEYGKKPFFPLREDAVLHITCRSGAKEIFGIHLIGERKGEDEERYDLLARMELLGDGVWQTFSIPLKQCSSRI